MRWRRVVLTTVAVAAGCAITLAFWLPSKNGTAVLRLTALDVGQGDAILLQTPNGSDVLVDGGPDDRVRQQLSRHLSAADRTIELVVLTHPDLDHVGGLPAVARSYRIERVLETGVRSTSQADTAWVSEISKQGSERIQAQAGQRLEIDGVWFDVLWPDASTDLATPKRNETSVVLRITYGATSFLLTGDISTAVESRLVLNGTLTDVDVLKAPHHGSISSSSEEFLDTVKPEVAVISVGQRNRYGHPHPVVMRRLAKRGVKILRTDEMGDVELVSDGGKITFDN